MLQKDDILDSIELVGWLMLTILFLPITLPVKIIKYIKEKL